MSQNRPSAEKAYVVGGGLVGDRSDRQNVSGPDRLISFHLERSSSVDGSSFFRRGALEFNVIKNKTRSSLQLLQLL